MVKKGLVFFSTPTFLLKFSISPSYSMMCNSDYLFSFQSMRRDLRSTDNKSLQVPDTSCFRLIVVLVAFYFSSFTIMIRV